jgi:FKBP-type peptidyl-prolyl cis-trans isomerase
MKKYFLFVLILLISSVCVSCSNDDDNSNSVPVDKAWRAKNDAYWQTLLSNTQYTSLKSISNVGSILYKVLETGEGTEPIYFTSKVNVFYTGTFIDGTVFDQHEFDDGAPVTLTVSSVVDGMQTALQRMHVGDKWEIWIPGELAYGTNGRTGSTTEVEIKPYTVLHFTIQVESISEQ